MFRELEIIDDFILKKLSSPIDNTESTETLEAWLTMIQDEGRKARQKIASNVLQLPNETHIEVFIQNYQKHLTYLANRLYTNAGYNEVIFNFSDESPLTLKKIQKSTYLILEDLVDYLRIYFSKYFLIDEKPTRRKILIAVLQFTENINDIQGLSDEPNIFINVVTSALYDFINNAENITYRKIDYLHKLVKEVLNYNHQGIVKNLSEFIKDKLYYLNFNSVSYVEVLVSEIKNELDEYNTLNDKLDVLSLILKKINQTPVQKDFIYLPDHKSLQEQITYWLLEEMCFLEKRIVMSNLSEQALDGSAHTFKIPTDMSVPQLAYFLRVLFEVKVINRIKELELLKYFAKHTKTKGTENISPESLRIKYFAIDEKTKDEVKSIIIKMLNFIQNNKICIIFLLNTSLSQLNCAIDYIS